VVAQEDTVCRAQMQTDNAVLGWYADGIVCSDREIEWRLLANAIIKHEAAVKRTAEGAYLHGRLPRGQ
jgi:hypothetical protein